MEIEIMLGITGIAISGTVIAIAYWKSPTFRAVLNSYLRKQWRKYKGEVFQYIDAHVSDIMEELKVDITKKTHTYIKHEVLRQAVDSKLKSGVDFTDEWVKMKYKEVLQDLIGK